MNIKFREEIELKNKIIVIKLSSLAVTYPHGGINKAQIKQMAQDISHLTHDKKIKVILVSSGSINAGRKIMSKVAKEDIAFLQACSAVGQPLLMRAFTEEFKKLKLNTAQVLLTHEDLKNKKRSHNIRGSISTLLKKQIIPILNENDCVSFDEITVGDNDQLSAMICETMNADLLCMLTGVDGLYNKDPREKDAIHYPVIHYNDGLKELNTVSKSSAGRGGMKTKIQAVRKLTPMGIPVIIGSYKEKSPIMRLLTQKMGSFFSADLQEQKCKRKSWILTRTRNHAVIKIDAGAAKALQSNASLLPIGVISTGGKFNRGDSVLIKYKNQIIAHGITEYSATEIERIKKLKTSELSQVLDYVPSKVVIHKDNLILKEDK